MKLPFSKKQPKEPTRGKLIAIEGIPGSDITAQINMLAESLTFSGYSVALAEFPKAENSSAALIEQYAASSESNCSAEAKAILYAVNHMELTDKLRDWLSKGTIILTSGYVAGNAARGGVGMGTQDQISFFRWVSVLEHEQFGVLKPDINIILHLPTQLAERALLSHRKPKEEAPDTKQLPELEKSFVSLAGVYPQTKLVHCASGQSLLPSKDIHNTIWQLVRRVVLKNNIPH